MRLATPGILVAILVVQPSFAQREEAAVEWQKRQAKIDYGVVGVGRHKLDELAVGTTWRMGRNEASVLTTEMALLAGDQIVVPGSYRVNVARQSEKEFALSIDGGSVGEAPQGAPAAVPAKAEVLKPDKPSKAIEVRFKTDGKADGTVQPAKVTVTFGENRIVASLGLVATKSQKAQGWTLDVFQLPADLVEKRLAGGKMSPVLALKKETGKREPPFHVWNLVLGKDSAELWPAPMAPTESFGFGAVKALEGASMTKATSVIWEDAKDSKSALDLSKVDVAKGKGVLIVLAIGKKTCTIAMPEPKLPG